MVEDHMEARKASPPCTPPIYRTKEFVLGDIWNAELTFRCWLDESWHLTTDILLGLQLTPDTSTKKGSEGHYHLKDVRLEHRMYLVNNNAKEPLNSNQPEGERVRWTRNNSSQWSVGLGGAPPPSFVTVSANYTGGSGRSQDMESWRHSPSLNNNKVGHVRFIETDSALQKGSFKEEARFYSDLRSIAHRIPINTPVTILHVVHVEEACMHTWLQRDNQQWVGRPRRMLHWLRRATKFLLGNGAFGAIELVTLRKIKLPHIQWHPSDRRRQTLKMPITTTNGPPPDAAGVANLNLSAAPIGMTAVKPRIVLDDTLFAWQ